MYGVWSVEAEEEVVSKKSVVLQILRHWEYSEVVQEACVTHSAVCPFKCAGGW